MTEEKLFLISLGDITSSLQFWDENLPNPANDDLFITLENGFYRVVVKELFDAEDYEYYPENKTSYIVELFQETQNPKIHTKQLPGQKFFQTMKNTFSHLKICEKKNKSHSILQFFKKDLTLRGNYIYYLCFWRGSSVVEQRPEKPCVDSSILSLATTSNYQTLRRFLFS